MQAPAPLSPRLRTVLEQLTLIADDVEHYETQGHTSPNDEIRAKDFLTR